MFVTSRMRCLGMATVTAIGIATASTSASAAEMGSMHVAFGDTPGVEMLNFLAAVARAKERGVDVKVSYLASEDTAAQAVVSGQADVGVGAPYALIQKVKAPIRLFYQIQQMNFRVIVNKEHYTSWKDLDGADIHVHSRGSGTEAIMHHQAKEHGIKFNSISFVPGSSVRAGGMMQGTIKATVVDDERFRLLMEKGGGKFMELPIPRIYASDEALYANINWLKEQSAAVDVLMEELLGVWREVNKDPKAILAMREKYNLLPDMDADDVKDIEPSFTESVRVGLYSNNGGSRDSVKQDFEFFTVSGSMDGDPATLKVDDFWYFEPLDRALAKLGKM